MTTSNRTRSPAATDTEPTAPPAATPRSAGLWRYSLAAAPVAAVVNLVIHTVVNATGVSFVVAFSAGDKTMHITAAHVAALSVVPLLIASALAAVASRRSMATLRAVQIVAGVVAVVSLVGPLSLTAELGAKVALASMHVVAGVAFVLAVERARRPHPDNTHRS